MRALLLVMILASHATGETVKAPTCGPAKTSALTPRTVRDVDWCNTSLSGIDATLNKGTSENHEYDRLARPHDTIIHRLRGVVYGDLDGDGRLEAAVVIERSVSFANGTHTTQTRVHIYGLASGAPATWGSIEATGDVSAVALGTRVVTVTSGPKNKLVTQRFKRGTDGFEVTK